MPDVNSTDNKSTDDKSTDEKSTDLKSADEKQARLIELARKAKVAMLTTLDATGAIVSRPMSPQQITDDGDLWFIGVREADDVKQIHADPRVGVTLIDGWSFMSFSGTAEIVVDEAKARELWEPAATAYLPEGPDDPSVVLVHVTSESGHYWDSPGGAAAILVSFVKSRVTGTRPDAGESESVDLS